MRFKGLAELKRPALYEVTLAVLPGEISIARYALAKAFKINALIREIHKRSYEWYGYTIANREDPELIIDIGLPQNSQNLSDYTSVGPEQIASYQEPLPKGTIINGWIHSHGSLPFEQFSSTDERNQVTVLDYVTALLRKPVAKREIAMRDLVLLVKDQWIAEDLQKGSVSLVTDAPITEARLIETIYGGFCYALVIGDDGWHREEIHYKTRGILSGQGTESKKEATLALVDTGRALTGADIEVLREDIKEKVRPGTPVQRERYEREAT